MWNLLFTTFYSRQNCLTTLFHSTPNEYGVVLIDRLFGKQKTAAAPHMITDQRCSTIAPGIHLTHERSSCAT